MDQCILMVLVAVVKIMFFFSWYVCLSYRENKIFCIKKLKKKYIKKTVPSSYFIRNKCLRTT